MHETVAKTIKHKPREKRLFIVEPIIIVNLLAVSLKFLRLALQYAPDAAKFVSRLPPETVSFPITPTGLKRFLDNRSAPLEQTPSPTLRHVLEEE